MRTLHTLAVAVMTVAIGCSGDDATPPDDAGDTGGDAGGDVAGTYERGLVVDGEVIADATLTVRTREDDTIDFEIETSDIAGQMVGVLAGENVPFDDEDTVAFVDGDCRLEITFVPPEPVLGEVFVDGNGCSDAPADVFDGWYQVAPARSCELWAVTDGAEQVSILQLTSTGDGAFEFAIQAENLDTGARSTARGELVVEDVAARVALEGSCELVLDFAGNTVQIDQQGDCAGVVEDGTTFAGIYSRP